MKAKRWIDATGGKAWGERYTFRKEFKKRSLAKIDIFEARKAGVNYLIASGFSYERYVIGSQMLWQNPHVYETHEKFMKLFSYPYIEIKPAYKTFAYSNPVIRIIDIREKEDKSGNENRREQ